MSDPRDIDEDAILKGLSAEELDQLEYELQEMDPEVEKYGFNLPGVRPLITSQRPLWSDLVPAGA